MSFQLFGKILCSSETQSVRFGYVLPLLLLPLQPLKPSPICVLERKEDSPSYNLKFKERRKEFMLYSIKIVIFKSHVMNFINFSNLNLICKDVFARSPCSLTIIFACKNAKSVSFLHVIAFHSRNCLLLLSVCLSALILRIIIF